MSLRIVRNTPQQLIIEDTPWLLGLLLGGIVVVLVTSGTGLALDGDTEGGLGMALGGGGMFLIAFAAFVRRAQVILDRTSGDLLLRSRSVFGYSETRHPLIGLTRASLDTSTDSDGGRLHRPVLILDGAPHPIVTAYTNGSGPQLAVSTINAWLDAAPKRRTR